MTSASLKLLASDEQDIQIVASVLQDAIVPAIEMIFKQEEGRFIAVVHRFRWDCLSDLDNGVGDRPNRFEAEGCYERIHCALEVQGVTAVQTIGFDHKNPALLLDLLTITVESGYMTLVFAGEARIRLKVADWTLKMKDFGESWPTTVKPSHPT